MNFEAARETEVFLTNREKATRLSDEIICMLKSEHISLSETRNLFRRIVSELEDSPL